MEKLPLEKLPENTVIDGIESGKTANTSDGQDTLKKLYKVSRDPADSPVAIEISNKRKAEEEAKEEARRQVEIAEQTKREVQFRRESEELFKIEEDLRVRARERVEAEHAEEEKIMQATIKMGEQYDFNMDDNVFLRKINAIQDSFIIKINFYEEEYKNAGFLKKFSLRRILLRLKTEFEQFEKYRKELLHLSIELQKILEEEKKGNSREKFVLTQAMLDVLEDLKNKINTLSNVRRTQLKEFKKFETEQHYLSDLHPFMLETYVDKWSYDADEITIVEEVVSDFDNIHIDQNIPFNEMKSVNSNVKKLEANQSKTGELYINSESVDFENAKPFIPEIPEKIKEKGIGGVMEYINEKYIKTHVLPDLRYYQYLAQLGDRYSAEKNETKKESILKQIPNELRDGNYYFFPGSAIVRGPGYWASPNLDWRGDKFSRGADRVDLDWTSDFHVVLLER